MRSHPLLTIARYCAGLRSDVRALLLFLPKLAKVLNFFHGTWMAHEMSLLAPIRSINPLPEHAHVGWALSEVRDAVRLIFEIAVSHSVVCALAFGCEWVKQPTSSLVTQHSGAAGAPARFV